VANAVREEHPEFTRLFLQPLAGTTPAASAGGPSADETEPNPNSGTPNADQHGRAVQKAQ
jgi:hypothetical protein